MRRRTADTTGLLGRRPSPGRACRIVRRSRQRRACRTALKCGSEVPPGGDEGPPARMKPRPAVRNGVISLRPTLTPAANSNPHGIKRRIHSRPPSPRAPPGCWACLTTGAPSGRNRIGHDDATPAAVGSREHELARPSSPSVHGRPSPMEQRRDGRAHVVIPRARRQMRLANASDWDTRARRPRRRAIPRDVRARRRRAGWLTGSARRTPAPGLGATRGSASPR